MINTLEKQIEMKFQNLEKQNKINKNQIENNQFHMGCIVFSIFLTVFFIQYCIKTFK